MLEESEIAVCDELAPASDSMSGPELFVPPVAGATRGSPSSAPSARP
jgi:hypothetical protein